MIMGENSNIARPGDVVASPGTGARGLGRLLLGASQRLRKSQSLKVYESIKDNPFRSSSEVEADQFRRLSELLAHCETQVPYYRRLFKSLGLSSTEIKNLKDFAQLPILTKDIIRENAHELVREDVSPDSLLKHHSGGSTGVPLTFFREHSYLDVSEAGTFRNLAQSGWRPGEMVAFFWGWSDGLYSMSRWQFELRQTLRRMYQFDPFHSGPAEMEAWARRWRTLNASVALGYASTISRFAEFVEQTGQRLTPLRGVFTTAEKLYEPQRQLISRVFGCQVYDCYGSSEVQNISAECLSGKMHINSDFVVLEVDESSNLDQSAKPFLVTSLWNYAMPFIRYRNEDCGSLSDEQCNCGNHFQLMQLNIARVSDNFRLPGGLVVHGEFFTHLMYGSQGIGNFQFHQTAPDAITLWIVPSDGNEQARQRVAHSVKERIKALTSEPLKVEVRETSSIPLSAAGKHRFTRSDVAQNPVGDQ
jgi:phenylacetate-CoA ligase